ncbi:MAG: hypothetical protein E3J91_01435 [Hadesarchaea archaeon]|nr:MAG: hypothetical protein E3J91_01435 [Hadesarchaea archaeon]
MSPEKNARKNNCGEARGDGEHLARETARSLVPSRPGPLAAGRVVKGREASVGAVPFPFPFPKRGVPEARRGLGGSLLAGRDMTRSLFSSRPSPSEQKKDGEGSCGASASVDTAACT